MGKDDYEVGEEEVESKEEELDEDGDDDDDDDDDWDDEKPGAEKWRKHYSSKHRILLVGEGDFSFSLCLARAFGFAGNMVATCLDTQGYFFSFFYFFKPE